MVDVVGVLGGGVWLVVIEFVFEIVLYVVIVFV